MTIQLIWTAVLDFPNRKCTFSKNSSQLSRQYRTLSTLSGKSWSCPLFTAYVWLVTLLQHIGQQKDFYRKWTKQSKSIKSTRPVIVLKKLQFAIGYQVSILVYFSTSIIKWPISPNICQFFKWVVMFMNLPLKKAELPLGNLTLSDKEQPS